MKGRLMSDAQLEEIRNKVHAAVLRHGPMTRNAIELECGAFTTPHYVRTSLAELIEAGRITKWIDACPGGGRRHLYSHRPYREGRSF